MWRYVYRAVDQHGQVIACSCPRVVTPPRPAGSSAGRCRCFGLRPRWSPTLPRSTRPCWMNLSRRRGIT
ncbi:transposase [Catellatospora sp. NEAU-YM18]|nr:transposase [Catellatospora tritici]